MAMFRINAKKRARILTRAEFKRMLKVVTVTRDVERNQLLLCFSHACGLRCTELASITIRDILQPSGLLKSELTLRAEITKNARVRTVPMPEGLLTKHIEIYLVHRIENNIGVIPKKTEAFRGLSPDLPVIFSGRGSGFAMARKVRVLESGVTEVYAAADALVMRTAS